MRPTTNNMFHTSLAVHQSALTARTSTRMGNRGVKSKWCTTTGSFYGTGSMEAPSWVVISP
jgi:hypothetical protein